MANRTDNELDPGRLYSWPEGVRRRFGFGLRTCYELERSGLEVRRLGRRSFVRGGNLIEVLWQVAKVVERCQGQAPPDSAGEASDA